MTAGFREFEFDLPEALLASMAWAFDRMESASLTSEHVKDIPEAQGVYLLLLGTEIVYIGKTDAEAGLRRRLERHAWSIQHRRGLEAEEVSFKALRVFVFTAMDLEGQLIAHYKVSSALGWNNSGFGSNDPGRNRDKTRAKAGGFDVLFPIDLDREIVLEEEGIVTAARACVYCDGLFLTRYEQRPLLEASRRLMAICSTRVSRCRRDQRRRGLYSALSLARFRMAGRLRYLREE